MYNDKQPHSGGVQPQRNITVTLLLAIYKVIQNDHNLTN
jgi:hypothetical protein